MSIKHGLLALLLEGPKYGFQLKKEFEEATGNFWPLNVGQVYTTLGRLVRDGLVTEESSDEEGQQSYRLAPSGRDELTEWFEAPRTADRYERDELTIKVAMAVAAQRTDIEDLLQSQRSEATSALQSLTRRKARLEPNDISQAIVLDAAIARLDAELRWLDLTSARLAGLKHSGRKK
jgi:DNA-binding PadR family transcriptional regulator